MLYNMSTVHSVLRIANFTEVEVDSESIWKFYLLKNEI